MSSPAPKPISFESVIDSSVYSGPHPQPFSVVGGIPGTSKPFIYASELGVKFNNNASSAQSNGDYLRDAISKLSNPGNFGGYASIVLDVGLAYIAGNLDFGTKRIRLLGQGRSVSAIKRPAGSTGDFLTFGGSYSGAESLTIEGGRYQNTATPGMDNLVINGPYFTAKDMVIAKATGSGLVLGKNGMAIAPTVSNIQFRENLKYDIHTVAGSDSTDGMWSDLDLAYAGSNSIYLGVGSQNMSDIHVWTCGLEDAVENSGIVLASSGNVITMAQSEKTLGYGVEVRASNNEITGLNAWGNVKGAIFGTGASNVKISGRAYRNCVTNTGGVSSTSFAAIRLFNCLYWDVDVKVWDNASAMTGSGPVTAPTYSYPGKPAVLTQSYAVAEEGTTDYINWTGSSMSKNFTPGSSSGTPISTSSTIGANDTWDSVLTVSAIQTATPVAGVVRIPAYVDIVNINAGSTVTSVVGHKAGKIRNVTITFNGTGSQTIASTATLVLASSLNVVPGTVLGLRSDGTRWIETFRATT